MIWPLLSRYKNKMLNFSSVQYFIYWWQNITKQVHSSFCFVYFIGPRPPPPPPQKKLSVVFHFRIRILFIRFVR